MDFSSSSHLQKWILSENELVRESKFTMVVVNALELLSLSLEGSSASTCCFMQQAQRKQANEQGIQYVIKLRTEHGEPVQDLNPLTPEQEVTLCSYYAQLLARKGKTTWDPKVTATAVTFIKRFFLNHSCMEYEVIKIVFTCLYVAGKVRFLDCPVVWAERRDLRAGTALCCHVKTACCKLQVCERVIDAERIALLFPKVIKAEDILGLECLVLGGLQFDLVVYQPYHFVAAMMEVRAHGAVCKFIARCMHISLRPTEHHSGQQSDRLPARRGVLCKT
jgi:hypothetical protein